MKRPALDLKAAQVATLTRSQRERRLDALIADARRIYDEAVRIHVTDYRDRLGHGRELAATVVLFSGGNDSTVLAHLFRGVATHAGHANTGIGIEATRQFVRDTCTSWGLPLLERHPPAGSTYRDLVLGHGFPGPGQHWKMYQRLKLRALEQIQRVLFLAGRRRAESARRDGRQIPEHERRRSNVWVSPLVHWTALDMNTYRLRNPDCPRSQVADLIHMSGECLCGSFAKTGELAEIGDWFPAVRAEVEQLQRDADAAGITWPRNRWGWGALGPVADLSPDQLALWQDPPVGPMCSSCAPLEVAA
jgi:3'-phosphoadenosine 5'-phosphosulfate sulfotransferase (PAPS reductase)/FAD synthetase